MINRCVICDYVSGYGSDYTMKGPFGNKVLFNEKRQEYICTECSSVIHDTINENEFMDNEDGWSSKSITGDHYSVPK